MLAPRDTPSRERRRLDGLWSFAFDHARTGRAEGWWRGPLPAARPMAGALQLQRPRDRHPRCASTSATSGTSAEFLVPAGWTGQPHRCCGSTRSRTGRTVWVGDEPVADHAGGYTPFEADVTALVRPGRALPGDRLS